MNESGLDISSFLIREGLFVDVRSPIEFEHASIPGAQNLPLFSNEERAEIGTLYKQNGKDDAVKRGIEIVGPKLSFFYTQAKTLFQNKAPLKVFCARGGMRSNFLGYFLHFIGFSVSTLKGGYKAYRTHVLKTLEQLPNFIVLGGFTGCGKTEVLQGLASRGEQILDLEQIAKHRGSSFGAFSTILQPSCEQFENELAHALSKLDFSRPVWIEDESRLIGNCVIPQKLFKTIQQSPLFVLEREKESRIQRIIENYGSISKERLIQATKNVKKKIGDVKTDAIIRNIEEGNLPPAVSMLLEYYDKSYLYAMSKHEHEKKYIQMNESLDVTITSLQKLFYEKKFFE